jgi:Ca2+-binding EF-hand superfamily protein
MRDVVRIPELFNTKPVIMRAYQTAKNKLKSKSKYGDDYVSKAEFRYFLQYMRQYYEYWVAFSRIDKNGDRRVSIDEFKQAVPMMNKWGLNIKDPSTSFKEADKDGKGMVLFSEFCEWAIKKNLDIDDDDDAM